MPIDKNQGVIFGVKTGKTYHYIGKTSKPLDVNGKVRKSDIGRRYTNPNIRKVFNDNQDVTTEILSEVDENWYDEKLTEIVNKYKDNHPLLNAKFMLEGKRGVWQDTGGYWLGKKRDENTLQKLSESKFIPIVQYDKNGDIVKVWKSCKEPAEKIFKDYVVVNGGACSKLYIILKAKNIKTRFRHDSYWFKFNELIQRYGTLPFKLDIASIITEQKNIKRACYKYPVRTEIKRASVIHKDVNGNIINTYANSMEAAYVLKTSITTIRRFCRGTQYNPMFILSYGKKEKVRYKVSTSIDQYRYGEDGIKTLILVESYNSCKHAALALGMDEAKVRRICMGTTKSDLILRYGMKKKFVIQS